MHLCHLIESRDESHESLDESHDESQSYGHMIKFLTGRRKEKEKEKRGKRMCNLKGALAGS